MNTIFTTFILLIFSAFFQLFASSINEQFSSPSATSSTSSSSPSSSPSSPPISSSSVGDITLIGTVGGYLYAVNTMTLEKIWSVNIGGPLLSAQEISTTLDYSMVPMIDGSLLYRGNKGVRPTSVTAKTLSENTPFHAQDGLLYNGEKFSKLYEIDLNDGKLLNDFSSSNSNPIPKNPDSTSVIVGRVDYIIRAYNTQTGQQAFNFTYGELTPISSDGQSIVHQETNQLPSDVNKRNSSNSSHHSFRTCRSSKSTSTALIYSSGVKVTPYVVDSDDHYGFTLSPHSMICTPKGEAVFAYTNGHVSSPLYLDSPATFAYIFKNHSHLKASESSQHQSSSRENEDDVEVPSFDEENGQSNFPSFADLDYVNDFDRDVFASMEENDSDYSLFLAQHGSDEEQFSTSHQQPQQPQQQQHDTDHPLPFPQSSSSLSRAIPILYQLEIPSTSPSNLPSSSTTLQISNNSDSPDLRNPANSTEWNLSSLLSSFSSPSNPTVENMGKNEIPLTSDSRSLMIYSSPISLQVSTPATKGYHEPFIFPLSSSITVTVQKPMIPNSQDIQPAVEEEEDGYLLISESDVSSWIVGMRVPYPFSHPRYDPSKISTISSRTSTLSSYSSSSPSSRLLPSLKPKQDQKLKEFQDIFSQFDYRYSAAFGEYEKCLLNPSSSHSSSSSEEPHCNLTEFIEIEKLKLSNNYKFFHDLHSQEMSSHPTTTLEVNTIGLLVLAGIFGGIFVTICLILFIIFYLNYVNQTHHTLTDIILQLFSKQSNEMKLKSNEISLTQKHHNLQVFHDQELGRGSNGTVVLRGLFEGRRHVAVKKMVARFHNFERERSILSAADGHSNIVRYIQSIQEGDFYLLVLELCNTSLWHYLYKHCNSANSKNFIFDQEESKAALLQICSGISHLHSKNIVHRDIKPHNILLLNEKDLIQSFSNSLDNSTDSLSIGSYQFKISDMGLSKQLQEDYESSLLTSSLPSLSHSTTGNNSTIHWGGGTIGWSPPEVYQKKKNNIQKQGSDSTAVDGVAAAVTVGEEEEDDSHASDDVNNMNQYDTTYKADIFSLGCVFHFILIPGRHPFGESHERLNNILTNQSNLTQLRELGDSTSYDLIMRMIRMNPNDRPNITQTSAHPYFWTYTQKLDFLNDFSDKIQYEIKNLETIVGFKHVDTVLTSDLTKLDPILKSKVLLHSQYLVNTLYVRMESMKDITYEGVVTDHENYSHWEKGLPLSLIDDLKIRGKYNFMSRCDCLRMIRNKRRHRDEIPKGISSLFETDELFYLYFDQLYPNLFMSALIMACKYLPVTDPLIQKYCLKLLGIFDMEVIHFNTTLQDFVLNEEREREREKEKGKEGEEEEDQQLSDENDEERKVKLSSSPETIESSSSSSVATTAVSSSASASSSRGKSNSKSSSSGGGGGSGLASSNGVSNFRTRMCHSGASCPFRAKGKCTFAHSEEELIARKKKNNLK